MTKKYSTKKALVASVLMLALCFSMLVGTTFAWFTDSVASANNIIKSGNLDVELYYQAEGQTDWTKVTETTNVFKEDTLWEPGHTEVVKLKVVNEGSLALKYNLGVNVASETGSVNVNNAEFKLSDFIKFGIVDGAQTYTRDQAVAAAEANGATALKTAYNSGTTALDAKNDGNTDEKIVTMVVYMPTSVGNEANPAKGEATPTINLGINLFATQMTAEEDSFGSDYDKDAIIASAPVAIPTEPVTAAVTLTAADVAVEVPAAVINALPAEVTSIALNYTAPQVDATTNTVSFATVELVDQNGDKIDLTNNTTPIPVTLPAQTAIAANEDVVVLHDGEVVASATVAADGSIAYTANHFCEVTVVAVTKVATADELKAAVAAGENVQFTANIALSEILVINNDNTAIYGMGYTLTSTAARAINVSGANGVTINGLTIVASGERAINVIQNATNLTIVGVTATAANYTVNVASSAPNAVVAIKNSTLNGLCTVNVAAEGSKVTVDNSTVNCNDNNTTDGEAYAALSLNAEATGGSIIATNTIVNVAEGSDSFKGRNSTIDGIVTINGSTDDVAVTVAVITYPGQPTYHGFLTLESAIEFAKATDTITLIRDIELNKAIVIKDTVAIDLNGYTISGTCNEGQGYLFMVNNGAKLTILDSSADESGKITFAQGTSNVGWAIDLEGELVLESGTIELTGDSWSIGYCVDVRPNAWGTAYTNPTVFTMNGGKVVSSDGAIRVASSSSETYTGVSAKFVMNGGEVEAAWDGIFVQQSNDVYDILTVELNGGKVASALSPVRVYGPVATSVVGGAEKPMTLKIGANAELSVIGEIDTSRTWYVEGVVVLGGGMTVEALEQYATIVIAE